jgi:hypothetical protein
MVIKYDLSQILTKGEKEDYKKKGRRYSFNLKEFYSVLECKVYDGYLHKSSK